MPFSRLPSSPNSPGIDLHLNPLKSWALSGHCIQDLKEIFGLSLDWSAAHGHLESFRRGDFSSLPALQVLPQSSMPGLWGGYSREERRIFLSAECPPHLVQEVLLEEIGHFLDHELCEVETPGDEGALFAATVLGRFPSASEVEAWASEKDLQPVSLAGRAILVEAAPKVRGDGKPKIRPGDLTGDTRITEDGSAVIAIKDSVRIEQVPNRPIRRLIGSKGDDTFVVINDKVSIKNSSGRTELVDLRIEDPRGGSDTIETKVSLSLEKFLPIEHLRAASGAASLSLTGNSKANSITGNSGDNTLDGRGGKDTLTGGAGHDILNGGWNDGVTDRLIGGAGNDTYYVENLHDVIVEAVGGGTDTIVTSNRNITRLTYKNIEKIIYTGAPGGGGGAGSISTVGTPFDDFLFGDDTANNFSGLAGNDTLDAKGGNDFLDGGSGSDSMIGGAGNDTYIVDSALDVVVEAAKAGTDLVISSVSHTLGNHVENLTLNASLAVADANINGTGNSLANIITGNAGNNQLDGGGGADTIRGGAGNDILNGGTADGVGDLLEGGEGSDRYIVDSTLDVIRDSGGTDTVETSVSFNIGDTLKVEGIEHLIYKGNNAAATLTGSAGDNSLTSEGTGADTLIGGAGNDTLNGGAGANSLVGGVGDDYYIINSGLEKIFENSSTGSGLDTVLTRAATFSLGANSNVEILFYDPLGTSKTNLTGSNSDNTITGGNFGNTLSGLGGDDYLIGGVQGDTLFGGEGNDTLDGKAGVNSLVGGAGDDYYFTDSQSVNIVENSGEGTDTVRSSVTFSLEYSGKLANVENLYLTGAANLTGTGNSLNNVITGNDGANALSGKTGNDTILGGLGADHIKGDEGNDSLVGGGDIQGDVPADASTPILLQSGQTYSGQINSRNETDWIRVDLLVGVTYTFTIDSQLVGAPVLKDRSDVAFGVQGSDQYWPTWQDGNLGYQPPLIGDLTPSTALLNGQPWVGHLTDHDELVLNSDGTAAYGYTDPKSLTKSLKFSNNIIGFQFTPFESGTFFIPVSGAGPALGSYRITLTDPENPVTGIPAHADNASNTLIGGLGADTLVSGNGRDTLGNAIGDILLGGTNGLLGQVDTDSSGDTLIGGDGNDSLDGGNGANSLIGGKGDDYYYIRSASDVVVEKTDGGTGDAMIVNFAAKLGGEWDIVLDPDYVPIGPAFQFANIENVTLTGSAHTSVLGSPNSDKIVGNFGNNTLDGGVGDDSLFGGGGRDLLIGGEGADYLDGGSDLNTLDGGLGSDTYIVNDRNDRIINEISDLDGGEDYVLTYFNFDPIQGLGVHPVTGEVIFDYQPDFADNSPSITKSQSFASKDLDSFYNLENFELLAQAVYGVGNALNNSITAGATGSLLLGMGGQDSLLGGAGNDSLYGDDPDFYASPDIYAAAPRDTIVKEFLLRVMGRDAGNNYEYTAPGLDYLSGGAGDDYIDGGRGFDIMIGGEGNDTFVQDNVDDYIVATSESGAREGVNELISSVDVNQVPDGVSKLMLVVANQAEGTGQTEVAKIGSFRDSKLGNDRTVNVTIGASVFTTTQANHLEVMYAPRAGEAFTPTQGDLEDDLLNPGKMQVDLSWVAGPDAATSVVGYTVRYRLLADPDDIWHTYIRGRSQDFEGTRENPSLIVRGLENADYEFEVRAVELAIPALKSGTATPVTLLGGLGNDAVIGDRITRGLPGPMDSNFTIEFNDAFTDPLVWNNPIAPLPPGFIFNPLPSGNVVQSAPRFATYLDGGAGNDFLSGARVNGGLGEDYTYKGVNFRGLNTMVGGQGSDTFVVSNGGLSVGDEFDWIIKYGNETPVNYGQGGSGESLNGGQHNLVVSGVPFLVLSDTLVHQGKFIDRINLPDALQFAMGNRLDNYIYETSLAISSLSTLVGNTGRDSITSSRKGNLLIGGTNYGMDNVGFAVRDFAAVENGGYGLTNSIFRDFDPVPASAGTIGISDRAQFWFVPGYYGDVFDPFRNRDTLVAGAVNTTLDGGAGSDSLVGSGPGDDDDKAAKRGDMFIVSQGAGSTRTIATHDIRLGDAVIGNGGNDTVTFTDSDYLWWGTPIAGGANRTPHTEGAVLLMNGYTIASDISNLVLQPGAATARNATGNKTSTANDHDGWFSEIGSNRIIGNEFDNILDGGGVGSEEQNVGGFDTLTGGGGSDLFVIEGYIDATNNRWNPEYDGDTGRWRRDDSTYTDSDFVRINDFTEEDFINLVGGSLNAFAIGRAPGYIGENNLKQPDAAPTATEFGIFRRSNGNGNPDLVAHVILTGGLTLDLNNLGTEFRPAADGSRGVFFDIATSQFLQVDRLTPISGADFFITRANYLTNIQTASTASLASLINSGDDTLIGGNGNDFIDGSFGHDSIVGGAGHDTLLGGPGKDTLLGGIGNDLLDGGRDADFLDGGADNDTLLGGAGADTLDGGLGDDSMIGGTGDDIYFVDSLADVVVEDASAGNDWVFSSISGYTLTPNVENLVLVGTAIDGVGNSLANSLIGNASNNTLAGLGGNDTLDGGDGIDTLQGGSGDDFYIVDTATDTIEDSAGTDTVLSSVDFDLSNPLVNGGTGIEHLVYTGTLNAALTGNTLANSISGGVANDSLAGGAGNDTLTGTSITGASEIDTLSGGAGADLFVLANSSNLFYNSAAGVGDYALITDFNVGDGDMLQLRNGLTYLFTSTNPSSGAIGAANSYLYRDDGNGTVGSEDNLIAAIAASGGALTTSDLGSMARYV